MKICVFSGSRSDRNGLEAVYRALLSAGHQATWYDIGPGAKPMTTHEAAVAAIYVAEQARGLMRKDGAELIVLHGDRYETLGMAVMAAIVGVPIAHLGGGEVTAGSQDDAYRHAITKLSALHFVPHADAARRVRQLGEPADRVHVVGDPELDYLLTAETLGEAETWAAVGLTGGFDADMPESSPLTPLGASLVIQNGTDPERYPPSDETHPRVSQPPLRAYGKKILVCWHPNPVGDTKAELGEMVKALLRLDPAIGLVLTSPNADPDAWMISREWRAIAESRPNTVYYDRDDPVLFHSMMKHADLMIGNSSAALIEAPCYGTPVINIGDRQNGRPRAENAWNCPVDAKMIGDDIQQMLAKNMRDARLNPYGDGHAAHRIASVISSIKDPRALLRKTFRDIEQPSPAQNILRHGTVIPC